MKTDGSPKERLAKSAARLFTERGYRAVGVDTIAEESGIGKMTLYRHFPSKDELIAAYLRDRDARFWEGFDRATKDSTTARTKLIAFFRALEAEVSAPSCKGCPFLNMAAEYPNPEVAAHRIALEHKEQVRTRFQKLAQQAGAREPEALANALVLLMDGAYMAARMFGGSPSSPARGLADAARLLVVARCS